MIEKHYGTLLEGAHAGIAGRLGALEAELERAAGRRRTLGERCVQVRRERIRCVAAQRLNRRVRT